MQVYEFMPENDDEIMFDVDEVIAKNNIIKVARDLGINVNKSTVPCIKIDKHIVKSGFPTMTFNPLKNTFKCWVCKDVGGDVIDLVMQVKNIDRKRAIEYLAIRANIEPKNIEKPNFKKRLIPDKESVYKDVVRELKSNNGIDLIAFISLKGGTGKSLLVNNIAFSYAILAKFISDYQRKELQKVELIDLDFGKPDQRLICGIEPKFYIEDILYNKNENLDWSSIKESTEIDSLDFISSSPVRKSQNLFYFHKNEIIYLINNSNAKLKLADFGGGINKDSLDFLKNIHSKIFVVTSEETSKQAVFYLMITMIYDQLRNVFCSDKEVILYLEKFRNCFRTGFRIDDLRFELERLNEKRIKNGNVQRFYREEIMPLKIETGLPPKFFGNVTLDELKTEIKELKEKVSELIFRNSNGNSITYNNKLSIYKRVNKVIEESIKFDSYIDRLNMVLNKNVYGLIVNRTDPQLSWEIQSEISDRIYRYLNQKLVYLGNLRESKSLTNISNYKMPYIIFNPEDNALEDIYHIADNIIGLKRGSISNVICSQKEYIREVKSRWGIKGKLSD